MGLFQNVKKWVFFGKNDPYCVQVRGMGDSGQSKSNLSTQIPPGASVANDEELLRNWGKPVLTSKPFINICLHHV